MTYNAEIAMVTAQAQGGEAGGSNMFMLIMLAVLGLLFFMMIRRSRKAMKTQQEQRASLAPGMEVMTTFGLFGTIVEVDQDENKAVIELSPGQYATIHTQAVGQVVEETQDDQLPASDITVDDIPDYPEQTVEGSGNTDRGTEYDDPREDRNR